MIPATYPTDSDEDLVAYELPSVDGLVAYVDYIPVIATTTTDEFYEDRYDEDGYIGCNFLSSISGLTAWIDYIPCYVITDTEVNWNTGANPGSGNPRGIPVKAKKGTSPGVPPPSILFHANDDLATDNGTIGVAWTTARGTPVHETTSPIKFGAGSLGLDSGIGEGIGTTTDPAGTHLTTDNFTIDVWIYPTTVPTTGGSYGVIACKDDASSTRGWVLLIDGDNSGKIGFVARDGTTAYDVYSDAAPTANTWTHVAVTRQGNTMRLFINGTLQADTHSVTGADFNDNAYAIILGYLPNGGGIIGAYGGYIDEFRMVLGRGQWTNSFTAPTSEYSNP